MLRLAARTENVRRFWSQCAVMTEWGTSPSPTTVWWDESSASPGRTLKWWGRRPALSSPRTLMTRTWQRRGQESLESARRLARTSTPRCVGVTGELTTINVTSELRPVAKGANWELFIKVTEDCTATAPSYFWIFYNVGGCDEIQKVAEFGTSQLASRLNSDVHFTLSYVETEQKKVKMCYFVWPALLVQVSQL